MLKAELNQLCLNFNLRKRNIFTFVNNFKYECYDNIIYCQINY